MKTHLKRLSTTGFALILGGALGLQTCPANEVVTSVTGLNFTGMTNLTFGYEFTVGSQPISVNALGVWDPSSGVGLNDSHDVGLWDTSGNLLTSVTVPNGNTATLSLSGFWYMPISGSVTLSANTTYVLGAKYPEWYPGIDIGVVSATTASDPEVTFGTARYSTSMTFTFPNYIVGGSLDDGYFGPNMDYSTVPEPTTCVVLGMGLLALAWAKRSRR
jgi:hypothetical protein